MISSLRLERKITKIQYTINRYPRASPGVIINIVHKKKYICICKQNNDDQNTINNKKREGGKMAKILIQNIGKIVSGKIASPFCSGDAILVDKGIITKIGIGQALAGEKVDQKVDARGAILIPGLIDSHAHPVLGDYTPRQKMVDFIDSYVHGGITSMISAKEVILWQS
jgi:adenine deaminase